MEGPPLGSDPEQNMHNLQQAVAAAQQAGRGQMRQLMAHQEPALQADESLLELAETADTKRCAACRIVKPVSEYYKDRTHSRGIKTRCKSCLRACKEAFKNQQRAKSAAEQVTVENKKCSHCGQEKPASEFSRSSYQRTGLRSWCKECSSKSKKQAKAEGRWKSYDSKAKLHQQRIEELIAMQQPRKCRKCEEVRQPDEFPPDPRAHNSKLKECQYCVEAAYAAAGLNPDGSVPITALGEYWQLEHSRGQQLHNALATEAVHHGQPMNDNFMRILQAAVSGNVHDDMRRISSERLSQLGINPEQHVEENPAETQSALLQQIMDQQQHRQHLLQAQSLTQIPGFGGEGIWGREATNIGYPASQRPNESHLMHYADFPKDHHASQPERDGNTRQGQDERHSSMGHFDQLRREQYSQPHNHQLHVPHAQLPNHHDWPSAFASIPRHLSSDPGHSHSPKRQRSQ